MSNSKPEELPDFDILMRLAQENPDELEALRDRLNCQLIESAPERMQHRLKGLLFQIDAKRRVASNPMRSCLGVYEMMHDSLLELHNALNAASSIDTRELHKGVYKRASSYSIKTDEEDSATVLEFPTAEA